MTDLPTIRDFSLRLESIRFQVDDEIYGAPAILSPVVLKRFAAKFAEIQPLLANPLGDPEAAINGFADLLAALVGGVDGRRLRERLLSEGRPADPEADPPRLEPDPPSIDLLRQALPILLYLLESWGLRPTRSSSSSPDGSATLSEDTSSTAGASPEESTSTS